MNTAVSAGIVESQSGKNHSARSPDKKGSSSLEWVTNGFLYTIAQSSPNPRSNLWIPWRFSRVVVILFALQIAHTLALTSHCRLLQIIVAIATLFVFS